jgi:hypothetical protein
VVRSNLKFNLTLFILCDNQSIQLEIYMPIRCTVSKLVYIELKGAELIGINQRSIKQSKQSVKTLISIYQI